MKNPVVRIAIVLGLTLQLSGCASMSQTEKGALIGAAGGGVVGGLLGGKKGAAVGILGGAALGAIIGNYYDRQLASRAQAAKKLNYAGKEELITVEDTSVAPEAIEPGSTVEANVQYTVLAPSATREVKVTETRTILNGKESLELGKRDVVRKQGTHLSTFKFQTPKDIERYDYTLVTTISDGNQRKSAKTPFRVN
jgi:hypothetical protein